MARRDPWVNMLRTTIACAGAALGGADAVTVLPFTWALGRPDAFARRIARNTHLVLQEESSLGRVMDPAHGAWFIEKITDELAQKSWALFQEIEAKGGMGAALESGFIQGEIARTAEARAVGIATGRQELTGVSAFPRLADDGVKVAPHPPPTRSSRAAPRSRRCRRGAWPSRSSCCATPPTPIWPPPASARRCSWPASAISPPTPARATWTRNFLAAGGIEAIAGDSLHNSADAGKAFAESGASLACICSSDAVYGELGGGDRGRAQGRRRRPGAAGRPAEGAGSRACRRRASIRSFLLVATRLQPLRVSTMH